MKCETGQVINVTFENMAVPVEARGSGVTYGLAHNKERHAGDVNASIYFLVPAPDAGTVETSVAVDDCVAIPGTLTAETALLVPPLALSLWAWDNLDLELGEAAIYALGSPFTNFIGQAALWRGGVPVIEIDTDTPSRLALGVEQMQFVDRRELIERLGARLHGRPGVAVIDLSGRPEIMDVLLEVVPRWGRLMLAGHKAGPLTVDFYNNIHRKAVRMETCTFDPMVVFDRHRRVSMQRHINAALRILENKYLCDACLRLAGSLSLARGQGALPDSARLSS